MVNIIYLPELDKNGGTDKTSDTFEIDSANARPILIELKNFLEKRAWKDVG